MAGSYLQCVTSDMHSRGSKRRPPAAPPGGRGLAPPGRAAERGLGRWWHRQSRASWALRDCIAAPSPSPPAPVQLLWQESSLPSLPFPESQAVAGWAGCVGPTALVAHAGLACALNFDGSRYLTQGWEKWRALCCVLRSTYTVAAAASTSPREWIHCKGKTSRSLASGYAPVS